MTDWPELWIALCTPVYRRPTWVEELFDNQPLGGPISARLPERLPEGWDRRGITRLIRNDTFYYPAER